MKTDNKEKKERVSLEGLRDKLDDNTRSLHINSVERGIKTRFKKLAEKEFNNDYGITLKYLVERYEDIIVLFEILENQNILQKRVYALEQRLGEKEDSSVKKMLGGNTMKVRS